MATSSNAHGIPLAAQSCPISRRDVFKRGTALSIGAVLAGAGLNGKSATAETHITTENADSFPLRLIATQKGKIITFNTAEGGVTLETYPHYELLIATEANRLLDSMDFQWYVYYDPDKSLRPTPDAKDIRWEGIDDAVSVAKRDALSFATGPLIFGDMGAGQSTTRDRRVPDWLINGNYTYEQAIQIGNDTIKAVLIHLQDEGAFDPKDLNAKQKIRVGVLNEMLNDSTELYSLSQSQGRNIDDPSLWFKAANYWQNKAEQAGDTSPIPRYVKEFLLSAKKYAGNAKLGIADFDIETWNDYNGDPTGSTPNQKAQVMYYFIKLLKEDYDLRNLVNEDFYVGMQAH